MEDFNQVQADWTLSTMASGQDNTKKEDNLRTGFCVSSRFLGCPPIMGFRSVGDERKFPGSLGLFTVSPDL